MQDFAKFILVKPVEAILLRRVEVEQRFEIEDGEHAIDGAGRPNLVAAAALISAVISSATR